MPSAPPRERNTPADSRWHRAFDVLQTNLQDIDATMDVEATADAVLEYGADTWLLNAAGISAFHPSDLPFQTRNPLLTQRPSGDLFGDAVAAAKKRGIKVIARFDMSKVSARIAAEHPEWLYVSPAGAPQVYNSLFSTCPSAEYYQSKSFEVVDEVLDRYDVDAIFFNWFNFNERDYDEVMHGPCHCEACKTGFAEFSGGAEHPKDMRAPTFGLWRRYTAGVLGDLTTRISDHVADRNRDIGVILRKGAPIEYVEGNNAYRAMPGKDFWPYAVAEAVSAHVVSRPESPVMVNCVAFVDSTYRMSAEHPEHFAQYMIQAIARRGNPSAYYFGEPGRLPMQEAISVGREVVGFHAQHRDLYSGLRSTARVALVRPDYGSAAPGKYWDVLEEFRGVYAALTEGHIPFDVVPLDALAACARDGRLDDHAMIVLPDVGSVRDAAAPLDELVRRGATLLLTGSSAVDAEGAVELASSPAMRALSPALSGDQLRSTFVTDQPQPDAARYRYASPIIGVFGSYRRFVWKPEARRVGAVLPQAPFGPPEVAYGHVLSDDPDRVSWDAGEGRVVHVPWTIGRSYREFGKTDVRDHLLSIVREHLDAPVTADLHETVEVVTGRSGETDVIHLINHSGVRRRSYADHVPVLGGALRLTGRAGDRVVARALRRDEILPTRADGDDLVVELPVLGLFEVVTLSQA
jgi:hypothetical protein